MQFKTFRLKQNYFILAARTILKENIDGDYYISVSDDFYTISKIRVPPVGFTIKGDMVKNNPEIFEKIK